MALKKIGLDQCFNIILASVDADYDKPDEKIFLNALKALNVQPEEAVMVGNRISTDIVGANRIGMKTILFKWNERYPEEARSLSEQPTHTISSLSRARKVTFSLCMHALFTVKKWGQHSLTHVMVARGRFELPYVFFKVLRVSIRKRLEPFWVQIPPGPHLSKT